MSMNSTTSLKPVQPSKRVFGFWRDLGFARKLYVAFGSLALLALIVGIVTNLGLNSVQTSYQRAIDDGGQLQTISLTLSNELLTARRNEMDFLLRWQDQGIDTVNINYVIPNHANIIAIEKSIDELSQFAPTVGATFGDKYSQEQFGKDLAVLKASADRYDQNFQATYQLIKEKGTQNTGLEGEFRKTAQDIEDRINGREGLEPLVITLRGIRREEGDYLLHEKQESIDQVHASVTELRQQTLASEQLTATEKTDLLALADKYVSEFDTLVEKNIKIAASIQAFRAAAGTMQPIVAKVTNAGVEMSQTNSATARTTGVQTVIFANLTLVIALLVALFLSVVLSRQITRPVRLLTDTVHELESGNYDVQAQITSGDEIGMLATAFNGMASQLKASVGQIAERAKALEVSAEVSRRLTSILDPQELASAVVDQIQSAFNYYYAQIYLFDDAGENLVLTAGTGEAGIEMMKRGHRLPKGRGLVGRAAENNQSVLVADTSQDPDWLPNQLLPDTKAEAAIPITIGDRVLGVLDVQDNVTKDITPEDITLLESLAGQVAISLQNAGSYARAEAALQEAKSLVENAPEAVVIIDLATGFFADPNENAVKLYGLQRDELVKVGPAQMSPPRQPDGRDSTEAAMEKIGEAVQGKMPVFDWIHRNAQGQDIPCEIRLVRMPGDNPRVRASVTDITERKRLQDLTALRARQQEAINTITQRIQSATTIEDAMQVAARELGRALGQKPTMVSLEPSALGGNGKPVANE